MEKEHALKLVKDHFIISGCKLSNIEVTFKDTKIWKEAKLHALKSIESILEVLDNNESHLKFQTIKYWNTIKYEVKKL